MATYEELLEIIKAQQKTIEKLTAELEAAREEIAELKEKLNKDSHNSSKPPSTDGYEKPAPRSQRKKSGKKAGGQTGHKGHHIDLGQPDRVERIYPQHCANCPHRECCTHLKVHDTCYVVDVIVKKETVKYEMMECSCGGMQETARRPAGIKGTVTYGNHLKALVCVLNVKGMAAMKNLCEIIEGLTGIRPGTGTVANMLCSAAAAAKTIVDSFPKASLHWVHVICTPELTYYALSEKRGKEAMEKIGFLTEYTGIVVHDFRMPYFKVTKAEHAMCCAHLLRELTGIFENHPEQGWAREMYNELLSMYRAANFYHQNPEVGSRQHYMECLKQKYDAILEKGTEQNPVLKEKGKRGRAKRGKIRAFIDCLGEYKGEVCRFADNPPVPFTNNVSVK